MVVGFDRERSNQPQARRLVGKNPYHPGTTSDFLVVPFQPVRGFHAAAMGSWQSIHRERLLDVRLDPRTRRVRRHQLIAARLIAPTCHPSTQRASSLVDAPVIPALLQVRPTVRICLGCCMVGRIP